MTVSLPLADELSAMFLRLSGLLLTEETVHTSLGLVARLMTHQAGELQDDATVLLLQWTPVPQSRGVQPSSA